MWSKGPSGPRSLDELLKQAEKATQVRRAGTEQVLAELMALRETTHEPELQSALAWLCNALTRLARSSSTPANSREVLLAADAVKRAAR
jgi:hypothetical protein